MHWGRARFQLVCHSCRNLIEEGDSLLFLGIGDGVECYGCGKRTDPNDDSSSHSKKRGTRKPTCRSLDASLVRGDG